MKYLKIRNDGELDIRLVALMGGTTKASDKFKIGQFGTGLKYTLAYLFRENLDFQIFIGELPVDVDTEVERIKEEDFEIIRINGHRTSITTRMGQDWECWMIIRELWCNALDEGGAYKATVTGEEMDGMAGTTTFYIQISDKVREVIMNWGQYFIHDLTPISESHNARLYAMGGDLKIYKQGVLIHRTKETPSVFSYDIKDADINELREYKGSMGYDILRALHAAASPAVVHFLENVSDEHYEAQMDYYDWAGKFGDAWVEQIGAAKIIHAEAVKVMADRGIEMDAGDAVVVPKKVYTALTHQFPGIGMLKTISKVGEFYEIHSEVLTLKIKSALVILESCGYFTDPELKFVTGTFGDKRVLARVNRETLTVYVSERLEDASMFDMLTMVIEENEHVRTGHSDCTRDFQQHFINLFTKALIDKNGVKL